MLPATLFMASEMILLSLWETRSQTHTLTFSYFHVLFDASLVMCIYEFINQFNRRRNMAGLLFIFLWFQQSAHLLNPPQKTIFQQRLEDISESVYSSNQQAPLGRSRLPSRDDKTVYGTKTVNGMCFVKQLMKEIAFNSVTHMQIFVWIYRRKSVLVVYVTNEHWSYKTPLFWMLDIFLARSEHAWAH